MPLALILSSLVAGSRVGGGAQALALAACGIDAVHAPTVLFGRHPGWGPPGGAAVSPETFEGVLEGIEANGLFGRTDLVITGYFASADQAGAAARTIDAVREASPAARIVVDPTVGDTGKGLYVAEAVADTVFDQLVPRADLVCPNAWELGRLTGRAVGDPASAAAAARSIGRPVLVSSIDCGQEVGVVYADGAEAWLAIHPRLAAAPNGTGDLLTALYGAAMVDGLSGSDALARAVGGVAEAVLAAEAWNAPELPIVALGSRLAAASPAVRLERLP